MSFEVLEANPKNLANLHIAQLSRVSELDYRVRRHPCESGAPNPTLTKPSRKPIPCGTMPIIESEEWTSSLRRPDGRSSIGTARN